MADYVFALTVTGYVAGTTSINAELKFSDGQTRTSVQSVTTPGDPVSFYPDPATLNGTDNLWITFKCTDSTTVPTVVDIKTIGPYLVSDVGEELLP